MCLIDTAAIDFGLVDCSHEAVHHPRMLLRTCRPAMYSDAPALLRATNRRASHLRAQDGQLSPSIAAQRTSPALHTRTFQYDTAHACSRPSSGVRRALHPAVGLAQPLAEQERDTHICHRRGGRAHPWAPYLARSAPVGGLEPQPPVVRRDAALCVAWIPARHRERRRNGLEAQRVADHDQEKQH